jgi:hypothetical protein
MKFFKICMALSLIFSSTFILLDIIPVHGATFTVSNINDSGSGSLRQAIIDANNSAGADTITFNVASVSKTIVLNSQLPSITGPLEILGETQTGATSSPVIEITGLASGPISPSFTILSSNVTISRISMYEAPSVSNGDIVGSTTVIPRVLAYNASNILLRNNYFNLKANGSAVNSRYDSTLGAVFVGVSNSSITGNVFSHRAYDQYIGTNQVLINLTSSFGSYTSNNRTNNIMVDNNVTGGMNVAGTAGGSGTNSITCGTGVINVRGANAITINNNVISSSCGSGIAMYPATVDGTVYQVEDIIISNNKIGTAINGNTFVPNTEGSIMSYSGGVKSFNINNNILANRYNYNMAFGLGAGMPAASGTISNNKFDIRANSTNTISGFSEPNGLGRLVLGALLDNVLISQNTFGGANSPIEITNNLSTNVRMTQNTFKIFSSSTFYSDAINLNGVGLNDSGDSDTSNPNFGMNRPVITSATISGSNLIVKGFTRPNSQVELFLDNIPTYTSNTYNQGRGSVYLTSFVEGSVQDTDTTTGSYSDSTSGSDTTNKFTYTVPMSSLPASITVGKIITATATSFNNLEGGLGTSEFSTRIVVDAILPPTVPVITTPSNSGTITYFTPTPTLNGTGQPNSFVTVENLDNNNILCSNVLVSSTGLWSCTTPFLFDDYYSISAIAQDGDGNTSNYSSPITMIISSSADMQIIKTSLGGGNSVGPVIGEVSENGNVSYTITATNNGPSTAGSPIVITDSYDVANLEFISISGSGFVCGTPTPPDGNGIATVTCTSNTPLANGSTAQLISLFKAIGGSSAFINN